MQILWIRALHIFHQESIEAEVILYANNEWEFQFS